MTTDNAQTASLIDRLGRFAPGLPALLRYRREDLPHDLVAGLSVAAVALPVGVAYAQLAGFSPVVGLYSSILPLAAYALFGTSRQLIVGPDAATCALVAAAVAPLAAGDENLYLSLSMALAFLAGIFCIGASFLRLGALADFLSRPILVGFLNGISLHIILGQIGKIVGFDLNAPGIVPRSLELVTRLVETHWPTLAVGLITFAVLVVSPRVFPRLPAALIAIVVAGLMVALLGLDAQGVQTVGALPAGLPELRLPDLSLDVVESLAAAAAGIALMSFSSAMLTARSFAAKNRYDIDVDREFSALGAANIASALAQGFAISGADSRTAMSDAAGGRTQVAGLVSAATIAVVLVFLTEPLQYVPIAALGAVLIKASLGLMDIAFLRQLYRLDKRELAISVIATLGVVWVGAIDAILFAVALSLIRFVQIVARPRVELLGKVKGYAGFHPIQHHSKAGTDEGMVMFRFNASIVFFNAPYFKRQALKVMQDAGPNLKWFVIDALPITGSDITGLYALNDVHEELRRRGAELVIAGRRTQAIKWLRSVGMAEDELADRFFPTLRQAARAYKTEFPRQRTAQPENANAPPA
jgi:high affinity sulfate transporter 1